MAQRFAVIGLGRFGSRLAANLSAAGQEVIGIDEDPRIVEDNRDRVTLAITLDATDEQALRTHGVDRVDCAIVGIGTNLEPIVLTTLVLKQIGVPRVIARTVSPAGATILKRIGADEVVNPEDEAADRWASRLVNPHFTTQFGLDEEHSVVELATPADWVGKTLGELRLRQELGVHVVALKRRTRAGEGGRTASVFIPDPALPLAGEDRLVLMGSDKALARLGPG